LNGLLMLWAHAPLYPQDYLFVRKSGLTNVCSRICRRWSGPGRLDMEVLPEDALARESTNQSSASGAVPHQPREPDPQGECATAIAACFALPRENEAPRYVDLSAKGHHRDTQAAGERVWPRTARKKIFDVLYNLLLGQPRELDIP